MRYRIETYRGYEYEKDCEKAIATAARRIEEVVNDNPKQRELRWVTKIDTTGEHKKLIYSTDEGNTASTPWLK